MMKDEVKAESFNGCAFGEGQAELRAVIVALIALTLATIAGLAWLIGRL